MKNMFEIPGLMGTESDPYENIGVFVKKIHSFKSESNERMEKRLHQEK